MYVCDTSQTTVGSATNLKLNCLL